jgi:hypothetical protein
MEEILYSSSARESRKYNAGRWQILQVRLALDSAVRSMTSSLFNALISSLTRCTVHLHRDYYERFQENISDSKVGQDCQAKRHPTLKAY